MRLLNKFIVPLIILCAYISGYAQPKGGKLAVAFYNCENFFDTVDNPAKDDDDFTPQGKYRYTQKVYTQKLHNIAAVLQDMKPAVIGLAEIENDAVLNALTKQPAIAGRKYRYVWYDGPDPRGINVALVYDPALFTLLKSEPLHVDISGSEGKAITRDVLHVQGILGGQTVDIFVNHWPSRRGGEDASDPKRAMAAKVNADAIAAQNRTNKMMKAIVMGDLNDNPEDNSVLHVLGAKTDAAAVKATELYNPFAAIYKSGIGTEVYKKQWNLFDQVIISGSMLGGKTLKYDHAEVYKPQFIQDTYKGHEGEPHRSFKGTHWINGYSDHYPVVVYFTPAPSR